MMTTGTVESTASAPLGSREQDIEAWAIARNPNSAGAAQTTIVKLFW